MKKNLALYRQFKQRGVSSLSGKNGINLINRLVFSTILFALLLPAAWTQFARPVPQLKINNPNLNVPGAASLRTNPELIEMMANAKILADQERYELAAPLWQRMIDESVDAMVTDTNWNQITLEHAFRLYKPMQTEIESTLTELPKAALDVYRLKADASAEAVVAAAGEDGREVGLGKVVRQYFFSSKGDDAAFELSGLFLDRLQFQPAARLLERVLEVYPDPTVNMDILKLRLAVALSRAGEVERAKEIVAELKEDSKLDAPVIAAIEKDLKQVESGPGEATEVVLGPNWPINGGNAAHTALMPKLPKGPLKSVLNPLWSQPFTLKAPKGLEFLERSEDIFSDHDELMARWEADGLAPSGELLFQDGLLYFKNDQRIVCVDAAGDGSFVWLGTVKKEKKKPKPGQLNNWQVVPQRTTNSKSPEGDQLFKNSVDQSFSIIRNMLVSVEETGASVPKNPNPNQRMMLMNGGMNRGFQTRFRSNQLRAYDKVTGKLKWDTVAGTKESPACFLGTPTPHGNSILIPVLGQDNKLSLASYDLSGKKVWQAFLCDESCGKSSSFSGPGLAISGGDVFVSTGNSLIFSLDATTGAQNWALHYPRTLRKIADYRGSSEVADGWLKDEILVSGSILLVFASDFDQILALDKYSSQLLWTSPRWALSEDEGTYPYPLGVVGGHVIIGSSTSVRGYKLKGGKLGWITELGNSLGRGFVSKSNIHIPVDNMVYRFSPQGKVKAFEPVTKDSPVGNLYSDGERLYVFGLREVQAFGPKDAADAPEPTDAKDKDDDDK